MIDNLFSSKVLFKVLVELVKNKNRELSSSEIISLTNRNQANILRELEKLINYKLVIKSKKNNQNYYSLNTANDYLEDLISLLDKFLEKKDEYKKIWTKRSYPPLLMSIVAESTLDHFSQIFPSEIKEVGNYWDNEENAYFYNKQQIEKTVDKLIKQAIQNSNQLLSFFEKAFNKAEELKEYSEKYLNKPLKNISNKNLLDHCQKFIEKFKDMYTYGTVLILIGYSDDNLIYKKASEIIKKKTKKNPDKFAKYLITLTSRPRKLVIDQQSLDILELARRAKKLNLNTQIKVITKLKQELQELVNKYAYLSYDLKSKLDWGIEHYASLVFEKTNIDIDKEKQELINYEKNIDTNYKLAIKELDLNQSEEKIFNILRELAYYKWAREYSFIKALYNITYIQSELARRAGISLEDFNFLLEAEIYNMFSNTDNIKKIIKNRKKYFLLINYKNGYYKEYRGKEAKEKIDKLKFITKRDELPKVGNIQGLSASLGKVTGRVKIINIVKHLDKMDEGDILVSVATTPDLLSVMRKARAIVTDEGGVTCHAAMVSRELKVPCIVGTKNATKILSDGDEIEVDANNGIIKILK